MDILYVTGSAREEHYLTESLLDEFVIAGDRVFILCPSLNCNNANKTIFDGDKIVFCTNISYLPGNIGKIKKTLNILSLDNDFYHRAKKIDKESFDLILFSTPPTTLVKTASYLKKRYGCKMMILLKDIFPQNAVDIGLMKESGAVYRYFRSIEKKLLSCFNFIGCISKNAMKYVIKQNPFLVQENVGICVNTYPDKHRGSINRDSIREKFGIPKDKIVFIYGGNLGKPQGIDFLLSLLDENKNRTDRFFVIVGKGTEQEKIQNHILDKKIKNTIFHHFLPVDDYDNLIQACDVGMVFLSHKFTLPNFPSRAISLMQYEIPIFAATDSMTDLSYIIPEGDIGWWCESDDVKKATSLLDEICNYPKLIEIKGKNGRKYLDNHFQPHNAYAQIMDAIAAKRSGLFKGERNK